MARTKQTAAKSTGGKIRKGLIAKAAARKFAQRPMVGNVEKVKADNDIPLDEANDKGKIVYKVNDQVVAVRLSREAPNVVHRANGSYYLDEDGQKMWKIFRLDDVRFVDGEPFFRVVWRRPAGAMTATWQRLSELEGQEDNAKLVLQWHDSGRKKTFASFSKTANEYGKALIAANDRNNCLFQALKQGLSLLKVPVDGIDECIDEFSKESLEGFGIDLKHGTTWSVFQKFLKIIILEKKFVSLVYNKLKKNLHTSGKHRVYGILDNALEDGVYLVAAQNSNFVAHCFAMLVKDGQYYAVEDEEAKPLEIYGEWIFQTIFIRKMVAFK